MTEKQQKYLDALFGEARGERREAATIAGYSQGTPLATIEKPILKEIRERSLEQITANSVKAAFFVEDVLDGTVKGDNLLGVKERFAAAKDLLDRGNIKPEQKVEVESSSPLFILPAKTDEN